MDQVNCLRGFPGEKMKKRLTIALTALFFLYWQTAQAKAQDDASVRRELEAQYAKLIAANEKKDLKAIQALRTADFHTVGPDGRVNDSRTMLEYSRRFLESNKPPLIIKMTIRGLIVSEHKLIAVAVIFQEVTRYQDLAGQRRKVETSVMQRETWAKTPDGWKLKLVDDVHDQRKYVDGKRVDPTKPYNPYDPPYPPGNSGQAQPPR
jgi:hypothetical protein